MSPRHDALVVGGGLAGASLAYRLARAGRDVTLIEREGGPHDKVCGEFLSFEAVHYLRELGVDLEGLGAVPIDTVSLAARGSVTSYPLPFPALSLSRRPLDEALLTRAAGAGAAVRRGRGVKTLTQTTGVWTARLADGDTVEARDAFLATGKRDLKGLPRPPGRQNDLIGLKLHVRLSSREAAAIERRVELFLFEGGYGGLEPSGAGMANLCLLVRKRRFASATNRWETLLAEIGCECPHLAGRLHDSQAVQDRPLAIAAIPYGFVRLHSADCWYLGDQAAVIPSFAGEGMSIALHSARLAAECYLAGASPARFQRRLAADVSAQVRRATLLSRLMVQGWAQSLGRRAVCLLPSTLGIVASATRLPRPGFRQTTPPSRSVRDRGSRPMTSP